MSCELFLWLLLTASFPNEFQIAKAIRFIIRGEGDRNDKDLWRAKSREKYSAALSNAKQPNETILLANGCTRIEKHLLCRLIV